MVNTLWPPGASAYVVSANGGNRAAGTLDSPLGWAEMQRRHVGAGDSLTLLPSNYAGGIQMQSLLWRPTAQQPIVVQGAGIPRIDGKSRLTYPGVTIVGMEITLSSFTDRESAEAGSAPTDITLGDGVKIDLGSGNVRLINCIIHDLPQGTLKATEAIDVEIYGCVIYNNGWTAPDRGHGHGIYAANDPGGTLTIRDCIIFNNFGWGIHCYGSPPAQLAGITIEGCTVFCNGSPIGWQNDNILVGGVSGTWPISPVVKDNCCYFANTEHGNNLRIGQGVGGSTDASVTGNVLVGGLRAFMIDHMWGTLPTIEGNQFYGDTYIEDHQDEYPDNLYSSGVPDLVKLRPNQYDSERAHLTIYNGGGLDAVKVNVSSVYVPGSNIIARNVQDYFTDTQVLTVAQDGTIVMDMRATERTVAAPQGWDAPESTFPLFGCFVLTASA